MSSLTVPTFATIRDNILRVMLNGYVARGVATPNVGYGSDDYVRAEGLAHEIEAAMAGIVVAADDAMPDTASGDSLDRWMAMVGLSKRPAGPSSGNLVFATSTATLVPLGAELLDPATNSRFTVTTGGSYTNGSRIPLQSVSTGKGTNLAGGTSLKWVTPPAYATPYSQLDSSGTSGGVDAEDEETARARLLDTLADYPEAGNAAFVASVAEAADPAVQKAFVYPAANGPGTEHCAVIGYADASFTRSRAVAAATVTAADSAVKAALPEYVSSTITATVDVNADLAFLIQLPTYGAGGWLDANPWPSVTGGTNQFARAVTVTSTIALRVESMVAPNLGASICWIDRDVFALHTAKILTSSEVLAPSGGTAGRYDITIDTPFVSTAGTSVAANDLIFPAATNTQNYLDAVLAWFATLGPGEKTTAPGLIATGAAYRRPRYYESWDYTIGNAALRAVSDAGDEVLDVAWGYQNGGVTTPPLPATISTGPGVFKAHHLAFYRP